MKLQKNDAILFSLLCRTARRREAHCKTQSKIKVNLCAQMFALCFAVSIIQSEVQSESEDTTGRAATPGWDRSKHVQDIASTYSVTDKHLFLDNMVKNKLHTELDWDVVIKSSQFT